MKPAKVKLLDRLRRGAGHFTQGVAGIADGLLKSIINHDPRNRDRHGRSGDETFARIMGAYNVGGTNPSAWSGNRINQVQHYRHWVYRAIATIMTLATNEPPYAVRTGQAEQQKRYNQAVHKWAKGIGPEPPLIPWMPGFVLNKSLAKSTHSLKPNENFIHLDEDHDLQLLLNNPNDMDTGGDLWRELILFLQLTGNGYLWKIERRNGRGLAELWVMPSHWVWPQCLGESRIIDYYEVRPWGTTGSPMPMRFEVDELIQFRFKSPINKVDGQSPIQAGDTVIDTYEAVQLARLFSIKTGAQIGTTFETDASYDPDDNAISRWEAKLFAKFQGERGFNRPAVLPPGMKAVRPPGDVELSFIQSLDQMRDYVLGLFNLNKAVVGFSQDVQRANYEAAKAQAYGMVVNPLLAYIGAVFTEKIAKPHYGPLVKLFWPDMTPEDRQQKLAEWNTLLDKCRHTDNEFRTWMNLEEIEGGNEVIEPQGQAPGGIGNEGLTDEEQGSDNALLDRIRSGGQEPPEVPDEEQAKRFEFSRNGVH